MILYLDTETSGLRPGQICQLSYIMQDKNSTTAKNYFFSVDFVEMGALLVHGFSVDKLFSLSRGKKFSHFADEIEKDILSADVIVAHNVSFDAMFLREEFLRIGKVYCPNKEFCTMKMLTPVCKLKRSTTNAYKYPKLQEACDFFSITDTEIKQDVKRLFNGEVGYHDARFDTTALYLVANRMMDDKNISGGLEKYL